MAISATGDIGRTAVIYLIGGVRAETSEWTLWLKFSQELFVGFGFVFFLVVFCFV